MNICFQMFYCLNGHGQIAVLHSETVGMSGQRCHVFLSSHSFLERARFWWRSYLSIYKSGHDDDIQPSNWWIKFFFYLNVYIQFTFYYKEKSFIKKVNSCIAWIVLPLNTIRNFDFNLHKLDWLTDLVCASWWSVCWGGRQSVSKQG